MPSASPVAKKVPHLCVSSLRFRCQQRAQNQNGEGSFVNDPFLPESSVDPSTFLFPAMYLTGIHMPHIRSQVTLSHVLLTACFKSTLRIDYRNSFVKACLCPRCSSTFYDSIRSSLAIPFPYHEHVHIAATAECYSYAAFFAYFSFQTKYICPG